VTHPGLPRDVNAALRLAEALIACRSVTPADGGCQALLAAAAAGGRLRLRRPWTPGRTMRASANLWAVHAGAVPGPTLVLAGHTDVVPTGPLEHWTSDPFVPSTATAASTGAVRPT
jgi:succinyl-diaminopimelate desuccinylase